MTQRELDALNGFIEALVCQKEPEALNEFIHRTVGLD